MAEGRPGGRAQGGVGLLCGGAWLREGLAPWLGAVRRLQGEPGFFWAYRFGKAVRLAAGDYLRESCFWSAPDGSPKVSEGTLRDARERPERYALVFLDLHNGIPCGWGGAWPRPCPFGG